jgi:hypothetical protein
MVSAVQSPNEQRNLLVGYITGPVNFYTSVPKDQTSNEITKRRDHLNKHCSLERRRCSMTAMQPDEALGIAAQAALLQNA